MNLLRLLVLLVSLPLLLGGCGGDNKEPVAETKPAKAVSVSPHLRYWIKGDEVTITRCDEGASGKLVIPMTIEGKSVTHIGKEAFHSCKNLTSITIGDSVTSIGEWALYDCTSLKSITFFGDAPKAGEGVFSSATPTIYHNPEAKGWGDTFAGRPVKLISEKP